MARYSGGERSRADSAQGLRDTRTVISDVTTNINADALSSCPSASRDDLLDAQRTTVVNAPQP